MYEKITEVQVTLASGEVKVISGKGSVREVSTRTEQDEGKATQCKYYEITILEDENE